MSTPTRPDRLWVKPAPQSAGASSLFLPTFSEQILTHIIAKDKNEWIYTATSAYAFVYCMLTVGRFGNAAVGQHDTNSPHRRHPQTRYKSPTFATLRSWDGSRRNWPDL